MFKVDTSKVYSMEFMFYNCFSLISLDLSKFNTSSLKNSKDIFYNCHSLTSLDLSNFNTSSITNMGYMFYNCHSLTSLDLSNFNTSSVNNMGYMFYNCSSLISLNLNNFDTSSVTNFESMFYNCLSLISLNIDLFNLSSVKNLRFLFYKCQSLVSLNLTNFDFIINNFQSMFIGCNQKLKYCIDDKKNYTFLDLLHNYENNCADICIIWNSKKYIIKENLCIDDCETNPKYKYENNNICYDSLDYIDTTYFLAITNNSNNAEYIDTTDYISTTDSSSIIDYTTIDYIRNSDYSSTNNFAIFTEQIFQTDNSDTSDITTENISITTIIQNSDKFNSLGLIIGIIFSVIVVITVVIIIIFIKKKKFSSKKRNIKTRDNNIINIETDINCIHSRKTIKDKPSLYHKENYSSSETLNKTKISDSFTKDSYKDGIKIQFNINNNIVTEINLSRESSMSDLIDIYYKKMEIKDGNQKIFICNNENIESEENRNKRIQDYLRGQNKNNLNVSVFEKGNKKIKKIEFNENGCPLFKVYLANKNKVSDLFDIYYEKFGIKSENKKTFFCDGNILNQEENKFIGDIKKDFSECKVFIV